MPSPPHLQEEAVEALAQMRWDEARAYSQAVWAELPDCALKDEWRDAARADIEELFPALLAIERQLLDELAEDPLSIPDGIQEAIRKQAQAEERERLARKERPGLPPVLMSLHDAAPELATIIAAALTVAEEGVLKEIAGLLRPFVEAKPLPGPKDDSYRIVVDGEALREAKALLDRPALATLDSIFEENKEMIPRDYWREVPCGDPQDPVAMRGCDGEPVCHCGCILDQQEGVEVEEAPGPVVLCSKCGCHVAVPIFEENPDA